MNAQRNLTRRQFTLTALVAGAAWSAGIASGAENKSPLLLGGPAGGDSPEAWVKAHQALGYRAAYCPLDPSASDDTVRAYADAARQAGIVIAEVGAWSNPLSPKEEERKAALDKCRQSLDLADRIGARCCVNISGSRNPDHWAGPHEKNFSSETFDAVVETTRAILDAVKPTRTFFTLEAMAWAYPDSPDAYLQLLKAVARERFAVHLDPTNMVASPRLFYGSGDLLRECFAKLGPQIRSCHAKDLLLYPDKLSVQMEEVTPGTGGFDYATYLRELRKFPDVPLMMEHLPNQEEYKKAADYIRSVDAKI
jgi:sugar phosphate isomerase/epimerase